MKAQLVLILPLLQLCAGQGIGIISNLVPSSFFPRPPFNDNNRSPSACSFSRPQDQATLRGLNFIENFATSSCLTFGRKERDLPVTMGVCSWNSLPQSPQLYKISNGNGGSIIRTSVSGSFGSETCLTTTPFGKNLRGDTCAASGKDFAQTWRFNPVRGVYQILQLSSNLCLRVDSVRVGAQPSLVRCNAFDNYQLWRICTSK